MCGIDFEFNILDARWRRKALNAMEIKSLDRENLNYLILNSENFIVMKIEYFDAMI